MNGQETGYIVTPNPEMVYCARRDAAFMDVLHGAALVVPDGIGIVYASRILGTPLQEKVAGIELGEAVCELLAASGKRLYLLGAKPGIAETAGVRLQEKYPGLLIAGTHDGYFKDDAAVVREVCASGADAVFVCLGFPKQEKFMAAHGKEMGAALLMGLGGSLDVYSGASRRAPRIWIRLGLEWLYRLLKEPKRIGRMMVLPKFLLLAIKERLVGGKKHG